MWAQQSNVLSAAILAARSAAACSPARTHADNMGSKIPLDAWRFQSLAIAEQHFQLEEVWFCKEVGVVCSSQYLKLLVYTENSNNWRFTVSSAFRNYINFTALPGGWEELPLCSRLVKEQLHLHKASKPLSRVNRSQGSWALLKARLHTAARCAASTTPTILILLLNTFRMIINTGRY